MGLYVLLKDRNYDDYPGWDFGLAGDKQFPDWMGDHDDVVYHTDADGERALFRPVDVPAWRARLPADRPNPDRFTKMFDILESDPEKWWIYYSW